MLNWKFIKQSFKNSDCDFTHSALTAAFDGQTDAAQLALVARHRARCADCQLLWSEWEKTRAALRATPAPIAPAVLQQQILTACHSLSDPSLSALQEDLETNQSVPLRADLIAYLEAPNEEFSVARLQPLATEVVPPSDLAHRILERTGRAENPARWGFWTATRAFLEAGSTPGLHTPRAARWGFGLAVPALAAWLVFAAQTSFVETPAPGVLRAPATSPNLKTNVPKPAAPEAAKKFAVLPNAKKTAPAIASLPTELKPQIAKMPLRNVRVAKNAQAVSPQLVEVSLAPSKTSRKKRMVKKLVANRSILPPPRAIALVDKTVSAKPKLMRVALQSSAPSARLTTQHPGADPRISTPTAANSHAPKRLADLRFADADFDETLNALARQRDNRPEDLGRALDEYSASLLAEHNSNTDDEEWG